MKQATREKTPLQLQKKTLRELRPEDLTSAVGVTVGSDSQDVSNQGCCGPNCDSITCHS